MKINSIIHKYYNKDVVYNIDDNKECTKSSLIKIFKAQYNKYRKNLRNFIDDEQFDYVFFQSLTKLMTNFHSGDNVTKQFYSIFNQLLSQTTIKSNLIGSSNIFAIHSREIDEISKKFPSYEEQVYDPTDPNNRDKLIMQNMKMALKKALHYSRKTGESLMDILQSGYEGLVIAYDRYRVGKGTKFSSYADNWIYGKIIEYLSVHTRTVRMQKTELDNIKGEMGHFPPNNTESFFTKASDVNGKSDNMIIDILGLEDENIVEIMEEQEMFARVFDSLLNQLNKKERNFIKDVYGIDYKKVLNTTELATKYNLKRGEVKDETDRIINKMGRYIEDPKYLLNFF